jgi:hypothetical protein
MNEEACCCGPSEGPGGVACGHCSPAKTPLLYRLTVAGSGGCGCIDDGPSSLALTPILSSKQVSGTSDGSFDLLQLGDSCAWAVGGCGSMRTHDYVVHGCPSTGLDSPATFSVTVTRLNSTSVRVDLVTTLGIGSIGASFTVTAGCHDTFSITPDCSIARLNTHRGGVVLGGATMTFVPVF